MALHCAVGGVGCYSAIVAGVVLSDHHVGCLPGSAFVAGFAPLLVHILLQIRCRSHILSDSCLVVFGSQQVGNFAAAGNIGVVWGELVAGNIGDVRGELAIALR